MQQITSIRKSITFKFELPYDTMTTLLNQEPLKYAWSRSSTNISLWTVAYQLNDAQGHGWIVILINKIVDNIDRVRWQMITSLGILVSYMWILFSQWYSCGYCILHVSYHSNNSIIWVGHFRNPYLQIKHQLRVLYQHGP